MLAPTRGFPNNPRLPLLLYRQSLRLDSKDPAATFESTFKQNGWEGSWRNGVYSFHHYHSNAHEVLGVAAGSATVHFGGPGGPAVDIRAGDVAILPAGTGHRRDSASPDFLVVGAYPAGQTDYDMMRVADDTDAAIARIAAVALPEMDPVFGPEGPLHQHWRYA
jgi:uncharacterized protein YjlB